MEDESELKGEETNDVSTDVSSTTTKRIKPQYNYKYGHIAVSKKIFNEFRSSKIAAGEKTDEGFQIKLLNCWKKFQEQMK